MLFNIFLELADELVIFGAHFLLDRLTRLLLHVESKQYKEPDYNDQIGYEHKGRSIPRSFDCHFHYFLRLAPLPSALQI